MYVQTGGERDSIIILHNFILYNRESLNRVSAVTVCTYTIRHTTILGHDVSRTIEPRQHIFEIDIIPRYVTPLSLCRSFSIPHAHSLTLFLCAHVHTWPCWFIDNDIHRMYSVYNVPTFHNGENRIFKLGTYISRVRERTVQLVEWSSRVGSFIPSYE